MEKTQALDSFDKYFGSIDDPRKSRGRMHKLRDIMIIGILSVICGADDFTEMEEFGKSKESFLKNYLKLKHGTPSHDTFGRVFSIINPEEFRNCFIAWVKDLCRDMKGDIVNIDGKALRHSYDTETDKSMIYMVSAWANANNLLLGQIKVDEKSNEITAIPKLLDLIDVVGSLITIDAMGTQKEIAKKIIAKQADYLLALKGNQGNLKEEVEEAFDKFGAKQKAIDKGAFSKNTQVDHGRIEERFCYAIPAKEFLSPNELIKWEKLQTIVMIEAYVTFKNGKKKGEQMYQKRFYITNLEQDASRINWAVQSHWGIETKVHWVLDVAFREDDSRVRKGHADENFAITRHIALNKLKNEHSCKRGIKAKRKKAGWDMEYLAKVLAA
ncbi:MAG: ISAs1 family transposase [Flavobacteriaceae bacterium]|nr:ISAs1 family transposase [Flavobacteriaceae bacterium]